MYGAAARGRFLKKAAQKLFFCAPAREDSDAGKSGRVGLCTALRREVGKKSREPRIQVRGSLLFWGFCAPVLDFSRVSLYNRGRFCT